MPGKGSMAADNNHLHPMPGSGEYKAPMLITTLRT